jgi:LPS-assembly lipoprotein
MWWRERRPGVLALVLVAVTSLTGCQLRPLYATAPAAPGPQADLPAISVEAPANRIEQVYRNALLYGLRGGGEGAPARYALIYRMTVRSQAIAVERGTGTPNAYQLTGGVSFLVKDAMSGDSVFGASVTSVDTYTRSSQDFSNIRALRDAEDRLARVLAELTQARLAAYFATN